MKYIIVSENIEYGSKLQNYFKCDLIDFSMEFDCTEYDFIICLYDVKKGSCSIDVSAFLSKIYDKHVALVSRGNTGFDINSILMKLLRRGNNLVVYSKYHKVYNYEEIHHDIINKIVRTDGKEFSEKFAGFFSRLLFRRRK